MSKTSKRFYWLKLHDDFFHQREIKRLRSIAGGDTYVIIYLKMLLLAMKTEGMLFYEGVENNFAEQIALDIDEKVDNVQITIQFLLANKILFNTADEEYELVTVHEMLGSESDSARKMRELRGRAALLGGIKEIESHNVTENGHNVTPESHNVTQIRQREEKEKEKNIDNIIIAQNDKQTGDICKDKYGVDSDTVAKYITERSEHSATLVGYRLNELLSEGFGIGVICWVVDKMYNVKKGERGDYFRKTLDSLAKADVYSDESLYKYVCKENGNNGDMIRYLKEIYSDVRKLME